MTRQPAQLPLVEPPRHCSFCLEETTLPPLRGMEVCCDCYDRTPRERVAKAVKRWGGW